VVKRKKRMNESAGVRIWRRSPLKKMKELARNLH
jgi:hypothetical protein